MLWVYETLSLWVQYEAYLEFTYLVKIVLWVQYEVYLEFNYEITIVERLDLIN